MKAPQTLTQIKKKKKLNLNFIRFFMCFIMRRSRKQQR